MGPPSASSTPTTEKLRPVGRKSLLKVWRSRIFLSPGGTEISTSTAYEPSGITYMIHESILPVFGSFAFSPARYQYSPWLTTRPLPWLRPRLGAHTSNMAPITLDKLFMPPSL